MHIVSLLRWNSLSGDPIDRVKNTACAVDSLTWNLDKAASKIASAYLSPDFEYTLVYPQKVQNESHTCGIWLIADAVCRPNRDAPPTSLFQAFIIAWNILMEQINSSKYTSFPAVKEFISAQQANKIISDVLPALSYTECEQGSHLY